MAYGTDPRGRQMTKEDILRQQIDSRYNPYIDESFRNMGRANEQGWNDYGNINQGYDTIMGMPQSRPPTSNTMPVPPPQGVAPSQEAIMRLFPNGMTPEALKAAQPQLQAMGIHLQNEARGDLRPRMLMPNGETVDLGAWGGPAQWQNRGNIGDWHAAYERGERGPGDSSGGQQGEMSTYGEFATTGGYSKEDIANMRARGVSPIRAAYANAEREIQRNRSLQGGYSPNANASLVKMARERGQASADATQNVEATLAEARNKGKQFGLQGLQSSLAGKAGMYGATPGMANMFGTQALNAANQAAGHGTNLLNAGTQIQNLTGAYDQFNNRVNDVMDYINVGTGIVNQFRNRPKKPVGPLPSRPIAGGYPIAPTQNRP